jgi:ATP-binding cassette subfamily C protein
MLSAALQQTAQVLHALPAATETAELIATAEQHAERSWTAPEKPPTPQRQICLDQVSVRYEGIDRPALDAVSVCFPVCTTTAIIGPSGAGKSTLADVLMGLLKADSGALRVDDSTLSEPQRLRWRGAVAYVPQETFLFNDSIRNNLLWGDPDASDEELIAALRRVAAEFVLHLPEGLDTMVGDGGMRLSGGERQRIALARALLKRPALILLDEATSALDLATEAQVRQALEQLHGSTTVVMIAHRLATLEHADRVLVLDSGRVACVGTWEEVRKAAVRIDHAMA